MNKIIIAVVLLAIFHLNLKAQKGVETDLNKKYQAKPPPTQPFGKEAFANSDKTTLRWLGMAGFLVNSRGTTFMIDPILDTFDMPLLIDFPITAKAVPRLDAVLITHSDNDHYSVPTCVALKGVTRAYHSTIYVDSLMKTLDLPSHGHGIGASFSVGPIRVRMTAADHPWQNAYPGTSKRFFKKEDCAGFWIDTPDGSIWHTGDSRLMEEHLHMDHAPDAILFDFSDSEWHFTLEGAVKLANAYPNTPLLLQHWGSVDAPDFTPFNGDPKKLAGLVVNPERIKVLAPGEPFTLKRLSGNQPTPNMSRIEKAEQKYKELFGQQILASKTDPELMNILQRLIFGEIFYIGNIDDKTRELITITVLTTNQTLPQLKSHTQAALNIGVTPIEIREAVYQSAPFIGFPKVLNAMEVINGVLENKGIQLPLENKGVVGESERFEKGREQQYPLYGEGMKAYMKDLPGGLGEEIPRILTESCFGDFYTREGLDLKTRELLVFCALATLGGAERQMASHAVGNLKAGNTKETLVSAMLHCYPYIGFPRISNAIAIIKEVKVE